MRGYFLDSFLDDLGRVECEAAADGAHLPRTIPLIDGRLHVVRTGIVREVARDRRQAVFSRKYGPAAEALYRHRFEAIVDFVATRRSELLKAGLAEERDGFAVREEFVEFLLRPDASGTWGEIPKSAILRFLDEWGHRWM
jgi:hypothetical protein